MAPSKTILPNVVGASILFTVDLIEDLALNILNQCQLQIKANLGRNATFVVVKIKQTIPAVSANIHSVENTQMILNCALVV